MDKNLGVQVKQDPLTVRLSFQPQVFDREDCKYYAGEKRNQCVVCGNVDIAALVKKYIVPHEYRKYMPGELTLNIIHCCSLRLIIVL